MIQNDSAIIAAYAREAANKVRVCIPAIVTKFDFVTQTVDVDVAVKRPVPDGILDLPNHLIEVPIIFPAGTDWVIAAPLQPGDGVWLMYTAYDCTQYQIGDPTIVTEPEGLNIHGGETCWCIPGSTTLPEPKISQDSAYQNKLHLISDIDVIIVTGEGNVETLCGPDTVTVTIGGTQVLTVHEGGIHVDGDVTVTGSVYADGDVYAGPISLREHAHNSGVPNGDWCLLDGEFRWCYGHSDVARVHSRPLAERYKGLQEYKKERRNG